MLRWLAPPHLLGQGAPYTRGGGGTRTDAWERIGRRCNSVPRARRNEINAHGTTTGVMTHSIRTTPGTGFLLQCAFTWRAVARIRYVVRAHAAAGVFLVTAASCCCQELS